MTRRKNLLSTEDEIIVTDKINNEIYLTGKFMDGEADLKDENGNPVKMKYPKYSELTGEQIEEIEYFCDRSLIEYQQVAMVFGEVFPTSC
jgi:hypothetical protein